MTQEISRDMVSFMPLLTGTIVGFAGAFHIIFANSETEDFATLWGSMLTTFLMMLGQVNVVEFMASDYYATAILLLTLCQLIGMIILLNLLIVRSSPTLPQINGGLMHCMITTRCRCLEI